MHHGRLVEQAHVAQGRQQRRHHRHRLHHRLHRVGLLIALALVALLLGLGRQRRRQEARALVVLVGPHEGDGDGQLRHRQLAVDVLGADALDALAVEVRQLGAHLHVAHRRLRPRRHVAHAQVLLVALSTSNSSLGACAAVELISVPASARMSPKC